MRRYRLGDLEWLRGTAPSETQLVGLLRDGLDRAAAAELLVLHAPPDRLPALLTSLADVDGELRRLLETSGGDGQVCGRVFQRGDVVWTCSRCGKDGTCVQCDACFRASDHRGHDARFHLKGGGAGCCDCGDEEAWRPQGCCPRHTSALTQLQAPDPGSLPEPLRHSLAAVVGAVVAVAVSHSAESGRGHTALEEHPLLRDDARTPAVNRLHNDDVHTYEQVTAALEASGVGEGSALTTQASEIVLRLPSPADGV